MNNFCGLCDEISGLSNNEFSDEYSSLVKTKKNIVYESDSFLVIPSFGPLNNSHLMIVPKNHVTSFFNLPIKALDESRKIIEGLKDFYKKTYKKNIIFFESGAGSLVNHSGGCIIHAHIHCIEENIAFTERLFNEICLSKFDIKNINVDKEYGYVWYKNYDGSEYFCNRPLLPSQFLRYLYAQESNNLLIWNWRRTINFPQIIKVIERYVGVNKFINI